MAWDTGLTGPHHTIAQTTASPLRVLAGPGTGKTFALMRRITRLLEEGADPARILVSTFTRTAAKDLESSLAALGAPGVQNVRAGTLHALSFSILSAADALAQTGRVPRPLMDFETRFLIEDLCYDTDLTVRVAKKKLRAFNAAWARLQSDVPGWLDAADDITFDHGLRDWLVFHRAMLIGELVPECRKYLRNNPLCPERSSYDHVLVDEYQDLNRAEQEVLDLLTGDGTLTVIGDENQSIYSFKHAHPEGIVDFATNHPNTISHNLTVCQRCPQKIVRMSNSLLATGHPQARQMQIDPAKPEGEVHIVQWPSLELEAQGIAALIKRRIDAGQIEAGKVLVLAQRRQFGYAVRDALDAIGVPAHSFFSEEELDGNPKKAAECGAQEAFTLLTLLASPNDLVALRVWCGLGSTSLRAGAWKRVRAYATQHNQSVRDVLNGLVAGNITIANTADLSERYSELVAREQACAGKTGQDLTNEVFPATAAWSEPLRVLAATTEGEAYPAVELLETLRSGIVQPEMPTEANYVRIMSLHKSKGLTADFVAVLGLVEGIVPSAVDENKTDQEQQAQWEEDRRVFYVAITRPKKTLVLSSVLYLSIADARNMRATGHRAGGHWRTVASRFLAQLGNAAPAPIAGVNLPQ